MQQGLLGCALTTGRHSDHFPCTPSEVGVLSTILVRLLDTILNARCSSRRVSELVGLVSPRQHRLADIGAHGLVGLVWLMGRLCLWFLGVLEGHNFSRILKYDGSLNTIPYNYPTNSYHTVGISPFLRTFR